jgi:hypothetical protein
MITKLYKKRGDRLRSNYEDHLGGGKADAILKDSKGHARME